MSLVDVRSWRSAVYDYIIVKMTTQWYKQALLRMPAHSTVLDVGIGTATSLLANRDLMVEKDLSFVGVDYDQQYVDTAKVNFDKIVAAEEEKKVKDSASSSSSSSSSFLRKSQLSLECCSIHDYNKNYENKFDVVYFSGSFMIIPEQSKALAHCARMLKSSAPSSFSPIIFTQTFENKGIVGKIVALFKPFFKYVLTIDFGNATFEEDFVKVCAEASVKIDAIVPIRTTPFRREVLVLATPIASAAGN